jgi:hypothetical protein
MIAVAYFPITLFVFGIRNMLLFCGLLRCLGHCTETDLEGLCAGLLCIYLGGRLHVCGAVCMRYPHRCDDIVEEVKKQNRILYEYTWPAERRLFDCIYCNRASINEDFTSLVFAGSGLIAIACAVPERSAFRNHQRPNDAR